MNLLKPQRLREGDTIATVSPSFGWAGDEKIRWKYDLGILRMKDLFGLNVVPAPNSLKGSDYLSKNPEARAEDLMWAFDNKDIKAIIANIGGNDCIKLIPFLNAGIIKNNPKIFIGMSDILNIHLFCYKAGLCTFYGHNLLSHIAEIPCMHPYSEKWFRKVLFNSEPAGEIEPSPDWTYENIDYENQGHSRKYITNSGYELIQGKGKTSGRLIGGHTYLMELDDTPIALSAKDFDGAILFLEDISQFFQPEHVEVFFSWLGKLGALQNLNGVVIGKLCEDISFDRHKNALLSVVNYKYGRHDLPVLYGLNFGHSSPVCIIPFGVLAEIDCDKAGFSIKEAGVE